MGLLEVAPEPHPEAQAQGFTNAKVDRNTAGFHQQQDRPHRHQYQPEHQQLHRHHHQGQREHQHVGWESPERLAFASAPG
eukprot:14931021-Alexandrium_andersonii.AAC.1